MAALSIVQLLFCVLYMDQEDYTDYPPRGKVALADDRSSFLVKLFGQHMAALRSTVVAESTCSARVCLNLNPLFG